MQKFLNWFAGEESGQSMVEYALIIGLIAIVLITALAAMSGALGDIFGRITSQLQAVGPGETGPTT